LNDTLKNFLTASLPAKKKGKFVLGVSEDKLGSAIQEELGIACQKNTLTQEILRGVRLHVSGFIKGKREQPSRSVTLVCLCTTLVFFLFSTKMLWDVFR
jgi:hypothetical protein